MSKQYFECPKCGNKNISCDVLETDADFAWRTCECIECHFEWQEVYQFHHNEDLDARYELDENGEPIKEKKVE